MILNVIAQTTAPFQSCGAFLSFRQSLTSDLTLMVWRGPQWTLRQFLNNDLSAQISR